MSRGAAQIGFLLAAALVMTFPCLRDGLPPGHDAEDHIEYQRHFTRQFWSGDLYPRWLAGANQGLGSPAFFLQYPAPYFAAALLRPVTPPGDDAASAGRALGLVAAAAHAASGLAAWLWLRTRTRGWPAALGAAIYMAAPYHLCVDLYERAALGELMAFVWLPLLALAAERIAARRPGATLGLAASHAGLLVSNAFVAILVFPFLIAWGAVAAPRGRRVGALARIAAGLALSSGLAAIYVAPLLAHRPAFRFEALRVPGSGWDFREGFLAVTPRILARAGAAGEAARPALAALGLISGADAKSGAFQAKLLVSALSVAAAGALLLLFAGRRRGPNRGLALLAAATLAAAVLMQWRGSEPLWHALPILQVVEFPWRMQILLSLALAILAALAADRAAERPGAGVVFVVAGLAALVAGNAAAWSTLRFAERQPPASEEPAPDPIVGAYARSTPPQRVVDRWEDIPSLPAIEAVPAGGMPQFKRTGPREVVIDLSGAGAEVGGVPRRVTFKQLDYPAWRCEDAASGRRISHGPTDPWGFVTFAAPPGTRSVRLRLPVTRSESAGGAISAACWLGVLAAWARRRVSGPTALGGSRAPAPASSA